MEPGAGAWQVTAIHLDSVHYPDWHPRAGETGPVYAYLVRAGGRSVLVDTGIGPPHPLIDRLYQPRRRDPVIELLGHGVEPRDIEAVILSHLHFDHVGGAWNFPGVPIYVQRAEWEAAQQAKYTIPEFLEFPGANFRLMDGDYEFAPGISIVATRDHTPGHQAVVVQGTDGVVVLAGQAIETAAEFDALAGSSEPGVSVGRLLAHGPGEVLFSHDHATWRPTGSVSRTQ